MSLVLTVPLSLWGQMPTAEITLPQAVAVALEKSPAHKMALAEVKITDAQASMDRSSFLPRVEFAETLNVGDDPVYVFGSRLRQGRFTQANFALGSLNFPDAMSNYSSRIGAQWNVFDSFRSTYQLRSSKALQQSSKHQLTRADQELIFRVISAYYGLLLSQRQLAAAEQTMATAQSVASDANTRVQAGTAVESDSLSAKVNLATRQQELIQAKSAVEVARAQFDTVLGVTLSPAQHLADALAERTFMPVSLEELEADAVKNRPDIHATAFQLIAYQNSVKAAKADLGPRLDVFGSWQADNPAFASGGSSNWMTGAQLRIDVFAREKYAQLSLAKASVLRGEAAKQAAEDIVRLDVKRAFFENEAARQMLEVARATVSQSEETLRMVRDRYENGLTTVTELLRSEDADRASRTNYWNAVYRYAISYAAVELARGSLSAQSAVVTQ